MSAELDMRQYLDLFLQEAEEQLEVLEQETLKLEQDPSSERLQVIFRAAHTLKGSSRAMGFQNMAELTHEMENVLDQLRNGELAITTPITDALLECLDTLTNMTAGIRESGADAYECKALVLTLQGFVGETPATPATPQTAQTLQVPVVQLSDSEQAALGAAKGQSPVYVGTFNLDPDCAMKFVRAFMVCSLIEEQGELLVTVPNREALEEEEFDHSFTLFFQTKTTIPALEVAFKGVSELRSFTITEWESQNGTETNPVEQESNSSEDSTPEPVVAPVAESTPAVIAAPTAAQAPTAAKQDPGKKQDAGQTVRVDVSRLDNLMNLVGELVIDRTRIAQIGHDLSARYEDATIDALGETVSHIARITSDLQDQIMKARMMPIETVFNRFPRVVRDLAQKLGKDVKFEMFGGETELDRSVIEVISDPLLHILRNSLDHGLELPSERTEAGKPAQGTINLIAKHQENHIVIEITDDGRGIDADRIRRKAIERGLVTAEQAERLTDKETLHFIFSSGFSTAAEVSEVSGRGVGMDIVRSNLQKLGGIIDLDTEKGKGTKFSLRLPLTLAIIRGLLVKVEGVVYVVPLGSVIETLLVNSSTIQTVKKQEVIVIRGMTTPLIRVKAAFSTGKKQKESTEDDLYVVIVGLAEQRVGLVVDSLVGEQEVVIKSLNRYCGDVKGVSGATILGDGNVALIMDVNSLVA